MDLYIAEKKVLAEAIADAIDGQGETRDGVIYKGNCVIVWCSGHLLTLYDPEDYDKRFKQWNVADLPLYFPDWKVKIPKENKDRVMQIGSLIKQADLVINCGDTDEEGQLLVDEILRYFRYNGPCKRLDTANTTAEALKKALGRMKDNKDCVNDGWSAYARMVSDKMFGINLSRFYTKSYGTLLTVGRVQTPTLGMVVNRDLAIESHKKVYYYTLSSTARLCGQEIMLKYVPDKELPELEDGKFLTDTYLKAVSQKISDGNRAFTVKKERVQVAAPLPFNLTELNTACGKRWGYTPDKVMEITQHLRDDYSAITYNRSDCQYLSMEHHAEAPQTVAAACRNLGMDSSAFDTKKVGRCFNDANITAHFAIIPTAVAVDVNKLSTEQRNVYELICKFYLIQFLPECVKEKTTVSSPLSMDGKGIGKLDAAASKVLRPGFYALFDSDNPAKDEGDKELCGLPEGTHNGQLGTCELHKNETKPPQRYTQTSLYADMTKISKYVDDPEIKKLLLEKDKDKKGENGSIGTSATRAEIIKKLIRNGYLEERAQGKKNILISTDKGRQFYSLLPDSARKADTTALWWVVQEDIKDGKCGYEELPLKVLETVKTILSTETVRADKLSAFKTEAKVLCKCPNCAGDMLAGKFGPYCGNKCGFTISTMFGKKLTEEQVSSLCGKKKTKISGIKKKSGEGTFTAFAVPEGVEPYSYQGKDGKEHSGFRMKCNMVFK